jgi:hypothetical protein
MDRFSWSSRGDVLKALCDVLAGGLPKWTYGGAYLFWRQFAPAEGEILYCGEAEDLARRQAQHLKGPRRPGNQFGPLSDMFGEVGGADCGVALLVIPPAMLPWLDPPDDDPFLEDDAAKRAGERLEGLLLRASLDVQGSMPPLNSREDASKLRQDHDLARYQSLIRYLLDFDDVTMDFRTFFIRSETAAAAAALREDVVRCPQLK